MRWHRLLGLLAGIVVAGSCSSGATEREGLIAFSLDGDIYVADVGLGTTTRIVGGPESDINPIFSPDGTRIAFVRGNPVRGPASVMVVEPDGSGLQVVIPEGFSGGRGGTHGPGPFAWTPDGRSIVVEIDSPPTSGAHDGELTMFDATDGESRLLVPPLNAAIGAVYFDPSAQIAPMFRPPAGDLILNPHNGGLDVFDLDLTLVRHIDVEHARLSVGIDSAATWSPDGSQILVSGNRHDPSTGTWTFGETVVIDAETGEILHHIGPVRGGIWSPDGTRIAFEDRRGEGLPAEMRIAVFDLASGTKHVLESSTSPLKRGATIQTITNNVDHDWYYEGVSWSPDGRSLLLLKDHFTQPVLIDIATDTATELPWTTDSFPSWQPAAP